MKQGRDECKLYRSHGRAITAPERLVHDLFVKPLLQLLSRLNNKRKRNYIHKKNMLWFNVALKGKKNKLVLLLISLIIILRAIQVFPNAAQPLL